MGFRVAEALSVMRMCRWGWSPPGGSEACCKTCRVGGGVKVYPDPGPSKDP